MDILGIGWAELVLILIIAFTVLGPERLAETARALGKWLYQLRRLSDELARPMDSELKEVTRNLHAIQKELDALNRDWMYPMQSEFVNVSKAVPRVSSSSELSFRPPAPDAMGTDSDLPDSPTIAPPVPGIEKQTV